MARAIVAPARRKPLAHGGRPPRVRRFVTVSHTTDPTGAWPLADLTGAAGRVDVLCRNVQAALCLSHHLREDVEVYLAFVREPARPRVVRIEGSRISRLHPDERSTAARIQQALAADWPVPDWKEVQRGLSVAAFSLEELLRELAPLGTLVLLDPDGVPAREAAWPEAPVFLLSDHVPFTPAEQALLAQAATQRVSLGAPWYHGNLAIGVVHWLLDQRHPPAFRPTPAPL